jgi:hypothetical protein
MLPRGRAVTPEASGARAVLSAGSEYRGRECNRIIRFVNRLALPGESSRFVSKQEVMETPAAPAKPLAVMVRLLLRCSELCARRWTV